MTKKQIAEYEQYRLDRIRGKILSPDGLLFICEANNYDPEAIGRHFLEVLPKIIEDRKGGTAVIERAKSLITAYCIREFGEDTKVDFSDPTKIPIAYTTTEDEKHEIQVNVNLVDFRIETLVDVTSVQTDQYGSLEEMVEDVLPHLSFDELVSVDEEDLKMVDDLISDATARSKLVDGVGKRFNELS